MRSRSSILRHQRAASRLRWHALLFIVACWLLPRPSLAKFARLWEPVPIARLLTNVGRTVAKDPRNARAHYTLGRLHSLAFAQEAGTTDVMFRDPSPATQPGVPDFPPYETVLQQRPPEAGKPDAAALRHLGESLRSYRRATQLAPRKSLYWLGLGWMLEQALPYAAQIDAPFRAKPSKAPVEAWQKEALTAYRNAYTLDLVADLKKEGLGPGNDAAISLEAGEGMLRIQRPRRLSATEQAELAGVRTFVKTLQDKPRAVTPLLFPLDGRASLSELLAPGQTVPFDLAGDGRAERWPWVNPRAGILVWDPERTGRITSGRRLFGSATWSMFWPDGYAPLAALDDNSDGWLAGLELAGLAVWCDRNGDGNSEAGEVFPLSQLDIIRVAVRPDGPHEGVPCNPRGMQRADGTFLPTYDWTPTSRAARGSD